MSGKISLTERLGLYRYSELTEADKSPPEFIVEGLIPIGLTFISGAPKTRKSFLALQLCLSVARGTSFLGFRTTQADCLYLDLEGSKSRISNRLSRLSEPVPTNVLFSNQTANKLAGKLLDDLGLLLTEYPSIRLIVLDTYSRARGRVRASGANAYDSDVEFLEPLQRFAVNQAISIVCVHHLRKGANFAADSFEGISGSMGISGSCDSVVTLSAAGGNRQSGVAKLEYTPRDAEGGALNLRFNGSTLSWEREAAISPLGNPLVSWVVQNRPETGKCGDFFPYQQVYYETYGIRSDRAGAEVAEALKGQAEYLFTEHRIGVQLSVKNGGTRGLRLINLS